jgi:integrase
MAIGRPRGKTGTRPVYVYHPLERRKVYVGSRVKLRGKGGAEELQRQKAEEFAKAAADHAAGVEHAPVPAVGDGYTVRSWSEEWLGEHHGKGTNRPERSTLTVNRANLKPFLAEFGDLPLKGEGALGRKAALAFAKKHPQSAKTASAMLNDAIDLEICDKNSLANRRQPERRERRFIKALTEQEVDRLAQIALDEWGRDGYGLVARAWVLHGAWVGTRPGETFAAERKHMNFADEEIAVTRIKKRGGVYPTDTIVLPRVVIDAIEAMPDIPSKGPIYRTVRGTPFDKGSLRYYWDPIRARFRQTVTDERWAELLDGTEDGQHFDFYVLRHRVGSHIVAMGGNEYDASHQLGNSPEVCRRTYIHQDSDHRNERNRGFLVPSKVVDLEARRERKGA